MKNKLFRILIFLYALTFNVSCNADLAEIPSETVILSRNSEVTEDGTKHRNPKAIDFSGLKFTPWDVEAASENLTIRDKKPYTIMVFMNGSDLESESGAATDDILEMLDSGVNSDNLNLILFTGGSNRWQNDLIPENNCMIWEIADGEIYEITGVGLLNMGDPGTLTGFIDFSVNNFPAEKYGLILWDHGGGSIAGYGADEKFNDSSLTLLDLNYAFEKSILSENELEFLGFDSCLMGSVEMAVVASDYAKYLVASEDLEPADGWCYKFLAALNENPNADGAALGRIITDYFMSYYGKDSDEILNLSVIDLSKSHDVMNSMGRLMSLCSDSLDANRTASFRTLAKRRNGTKTFGEGSPRDNDCDMVDIGDMAHKLSDLYPEEATEVISALDSSVVYNRHNSDVNLKGMSTYYIYGGISAGRWSLNTYESLSMNQGYTDYLKDFFKSLAGGQSRSANLKSPDEIISTSLTLWKPLKDKDGYYIMTGIRDAENPYTLWPMIGGKNICLHKIAGLSGREFYAVPITLNGMDCDIIILVCENFPDGKILGARHEEGIIIQKGITPIEAGDKISFYYKGKSFGAGNEEINWYLSEEITADENLQLEWLPLSGNENYFSLLKTDIRQNDYYGELYTE